MVVNCQLGVHALSSFRLGVSFFSRLFSFVGAQSLDVEEYCFSLSFALKYQSEIAFKFFFVCTRTDFAFHMGYPNGA